ncbi:hypothetical protein [Agromyces salentinus]|uniref:hypothetical protein n=1 Tax=Agromyces salentinus TaxID=269421 RepID=UPI0012F93828|nr:hypothetical protein [Agromyces salentinus]
MGNPASNAPAGDDVCDTAAFDTDAVDTDAFDAGPSDAGEAVCWLARVCDACGALVEGVGAAPCWRCGAVLVQE